MNKNQLKQVQSLKYAKYRKLYGKFFIEGSRLVKGALDWSSTVEDIYCTRVFYNDNSTSAIFNNIEKGKVEIVSEEVLRKICSTKSPSGIAAICTMPNKNSIDLKEKQWLYLDEISDPGNLGTFLRSASWFGLNNIALSPNSVDPYNPKVVRAAMGAHFSLNLIKNIDLKEFYSTHTIVAANQKGTELTNFNFPKKSVFVFGNEAHGISSKSIKIAQQFITIKKYGVGESLNVASAASIIMHIIQSNK
tara:strand:+ start:69 stop:812 length:744 start_codon:yes stop_codon:yes gene_type:complete